MVFRFRDLNLAAAIGCATFIAVNTAALELTDRAAVDRNGIRLLCETGTTKTDRLGVWNIWPNYTGIAIDGLKLDGKPCDFNFNYSPADTAIGWLDGHLFSLNDEKGEEVLRLEQVRRGRFRLTAGEQKALSLPQNWDCTVINWENLTPRDLTLRLDGQRAALIMNGQTVVSLALPPLPAGTYSAVLGRKGEDRGALGWYRSFDHLPAAGAIPEPQPLPGKPEWAARVAKLEAQFVTPEMDKIPFDANRINYTNARTAAAYIALDGLWYRLHKNLDPGFEFFLTELEKLAEEARRNSTADYTIELDGIRQAPEFFLSAEDTDFYYGDCGWGLAAYAPELARLGVNLVAEHIWPGAVLDNQGKPTDVMLTRRTMPQLEEFKKYQINFDLMIAPYTPPYLLKQHPEWEGLFFGLGVEGEAEKLKQHAAEWKGRQAGHGFLKASIVDPDYRAMCETFLNYLLPWFKGNDVIVAIDLANEVQFEDYSPLMQQRFRNYLKQKYDSIDALNQAWKSDYTSFDDILMVRPLVFDRSNPARFWDWVLCNREVGTEHFQFLHALCRRNLPEVPTHIKHLPHEFGTPWYELGSDARNFYDYADGIDRKALSQLTEIIGTDSWADNAHDASGRLSSDVPPQSMYFNLLRSYNPDKWIFDSEWHILRCDPPATPPACLDMVMQQNAVHGLKAGTFWLVCPGNGQHLELSSTAPLMLQSGLATAKIRRSRELFHALAQRPRRFGVLYSPKSRYIGGDLHTLRLQNLFEASLYAGIELRLVDERQLINGEITAEDLDVLLLTDCPRPMEETPEALRKFASNGGKLLRYGKFGDQLPQSAQRDLPFVRTGRLSPSPQTLMRLLRKEAAEFGLAPRIDVVGSNGEPVWGVEFHSAGLDDGRAVLYIANYSKEPQTVTIKSPVLIHDAVSGETLDGQTVTLPVWGTFLGVGESL